MSSWRSYRAGCGWCTLSHSGTFHSCSSAVSRRPAVARALMTATAAVATAPRLIPPAHAPCNPTISLPLQSPSSSYSSYSLCTSASPRPVYSSTTATTRQSLVSLFQRRLYSHSTMADLKWPAARVRQTFLDFFEKKGHTIGMSLRCIFFSDHPQHSTTTGRTESCQNSNIFFLVDSYALATNNTVCSALWLCRSSQ